MVAVGTSAPELATSVVASWRGRDDMAVANLLGSNIFNSLAIVGVAGLVRPLPVPAEITARDGWWMLGLSLLLLPLMRSGMRVNQLEGAILVALYGLYLLLLLGLGAG